MNAKMKYPGEWYLPDSNTKLDGRLIFDSETKTIYLELFGNKYLDGCPVINNDPERDKRYHSKEHNRSHESRHEIILGETRSQVSLYDCDWTGTEDIGKNIYLIKYRVRFVFFDALVKKIDDLQIESAVFIYPFLASWFDGFGSVNKLGRKKSDISDFTDQGDETSTFTVTDNLKFTVFDQVETGFKDINTHHEIKYQKLIRFEYHTPVLFKELLSDTLTFKKLMELVHGKPLKYRMLDVTVKTEKLFRFDRTYFQKTEPSSINLNVGNFSLHAGKDVTVHMQHQRYMLFSAWNLERKEIIHIIGKWFSNKQLENVYNLYIDSNNYLQNTGAIISKVMYENKFLNIIQGLEAYYRKISLKANIGKDILKENDAKKIEFDKNKSEILKKLDAGSSLKEWFNSHFNYREHHKVQKLESILKSLIIHFQNSIDHLFGENDVVNFFPKYASVARNRLSHGKNENRIPGNELSRFYEFSQILLALCILESLDIPNAFKKIDEFSPYIDFMRLIRQTKIIFKKKDG